MHREYVMSQQEPTIALSLPLSVVNYLLSVAAERPFKESNAVIATLQKQAQDSIAELERPEKEDPTARKTSPLPRIGT